jgi:hypothetical protein
MREKEGERGRELTHTDTHTHIGAPISETRSRTRRQGEMPRSLQQASQLVLSTVVHMLSLRELARLLSAWKIWQQGVRLAEAPWMQKQLATRMMALWVDGPSSVWYDRRIALCASPLVLKLWADCRGHDLAMIPIVWPTSTVGDHNYANYVRYLHLINCPTHPNLSYYLGLEDQEGTNFGRVPCFQFLEPVALAGPDHPGPHTLREITFVIRVYVDGVLCMAHDMDHTHFEPYDSVAVTLAETPVEGIMLDVFPHDWECPLGKFIKDEGAAVFGRIRLVLSARNLRTGREASLCALAATRYCMDSTGDPREYEDYDGLQHQFFYATVLVQWPSIKECSRHVVVVTACIGVEVTPVSPSDRGRLYGENADPNVVVKFRMKDTNARIDVSKVYCTCPNQGASCMCHPNHPFNSLGSEDVGICSVLDPLVVSLDARREWVYGEDGGLPATGEVTEGEISGSDVLCANHLLAIIQRVLQPNLVK